MKTMKRLGELAWIGVESGLSIGLLRIALASNKFGVACAKAGAKLGADVAERAVRSEFVNDQGRAELSQKLQEIRKAMTDIS